MVQGLYEVKDPAKWKGLFTGEVFYDGSCLQHHNDPSLSRAGWSVVKIEPQGHASIIMNGVVPATEPQTSQSGEQTGQAMAHRYSAPPFWLHGDCKGVTGMNGKPIAFVLDAKRPHADKYRIAAAALSCWDGPIRYHHDWVKAHLLGDDQDPADIVDTVDRWFALGNREADKYAKEAVERHPAQPMQFWKRLD